MHSVQLLPSREEREDGNTKRAYEMGAEDDGWTELGEVDLGLEELEHKEQYDHEVVNDDRERAVKQLLQLIEEARRGKP